ncbi:alpha-tocopherol transfer protein-like [Leguminivora glycinivorella]|uniref:alpha-tocopherol transfer protein-like n=1 Tax=Leguminivora glycinivorella TaxID=1035111 RepID=UPI00200FA736|nr:alpha-tocopherol transfer protein-like [Leguminivora glycinivorella]
MEQIRIFPYTAEERRRMIKEFGFTENGIKEDVEAIMDWFKRQPHLVEAGIDSEVIVKMLIMAKGSREKVKSKIDKFYKYRGLSPDLIHSRIEVLKGDEDFFTFYRQAISTKLYEGKRITTLKFVDPNPSSFKIEEIFRNSYMVGDLRLKYDYMLGEIWLLDLKNITLGHFLRINPMVVQRASQMFQEGSGFRVFSIHVLNVPSIGRQIYNLFKQFIKPKLLERLMVHGTLEELYKVLPKMYLPKDYGGDDYSMDEFKDLYQNEFRSGTTLQYLLDSCKKVSDEKKRPGVNKNEELAGTFKQLNLD